MLLGSGWIEISTPSQDAYSVTGVELRGRDWSLVLQSCATRSKVFPSKIVSWGEDRTGAPSVDASGKHAGWEVMKLFYWTEQHMFTEHLPCTRTV